MSLSVLGLFFVGAAAADSVDLPEANVVGLVQTWVTLMDQDEEAIADPGGYGDPEDDPGFKLRRVRMGIEGKNDSVKYGVTVGASAPFDTVAEAAGQGLNLTLVDTYGGYAPIKGLWVTAGLQKVPVSREALMASSQLSFTERAVSTEWLTPGRDLGAVVDYRWKYIRTRIGAFNGGGSLAGDDNAGKLYAARVEVKVGDGAVYRTYGKSEGLTAGLAVDGWVNHDTAVNSQGLGADVIVRAGGLAFVAEGRTVTAGPNEDLIDVPGVFSETERQGFMVQLGYTVKGLEPVFRYSVLDDDLSSEDSGDVAELLSGMTWHGKGDQVRAGLGYALRNEVGPIKVTNDTIRAWLQLKI